MTSIATIASRAGFQVLLLTSGEDLTFRGASVRAVVDRQPEREVPNDRVDFQEREASRIELFRSAVQGKPRSGEYFKDVAGGNHRIQKVGGTDLTWWCECDVTGDEEAPGS